MCGVVVELSKSYLSQWKNHKTPFCYEIATVWHAFTSI